MRKLMPLFTLLVIVIINLWSQNALFSLPVEDPINQVALNVAEEGQVPPVMPEYTTMDNAFPNPFKIAGNTTINVAVKAGEIGKVHIYNVLGNNIRSFEVKEGIHSLIWDGRDNKGNQCSSGVYFYRLHTPSLNQTRKVVIIK